MNCNYKVKIKDIQNKYQFKIFCKTYDDTEIQEDIDTLEDDVEALQEENAYLNSLVEQAFDKKEVEGEELSIDNTIEAKMNVSLYGNTKQETTTGKNLLPITRSKGYSVTSNGVTFTINDDYSVSIKGTATATAYINLETTAIPFTLKAGTYTLSKGTKSKEELAIWYGDNSVLRVVKNDTDTLTFTINQNTTYESFRTLVVVYKDDTVDDIIYPMLEQGSTATPYEPYTNGASPNPDYPQKIQRVTGNNSVSITGKNLFNGIFELGGYQILDGTKGSGNDRIRTPGFIKVNPNQTYSLSFENAGSVYVLEYDKNKAYLKYTLAIYHLLSGNFTTDVKTEYITFYYLPYQHELSLNEKCQLEVGSTATEYEPYQSASYPISLGDIELCKIGDYQDYFYKSGSIWYLHKEINKITSYNGETITTSYISTTGELSTGAKVYYVVTPTDTKITDTTLISQLEALKTAMSYAEQTNISQINDDIPFILKVTALASYNSRIVALENAILNANRSTQTKNARKSNEVIEEPKKEVVDDNKDENIIKEEE